MATLTPKQEELLRWIVQQVDNGLLGDELRVMWYSGDNRQDYIVTGEASDQMLEHPPSGLTQGTFSALISAEFLLPGVKDKDAIAYTITGKGLAYGRQLLQGTPSQGQTTVHGNQTNITGGVNGPVLSGTFHAPVTIGGAQTPPARQSEARSADTTASARVQLRKLLENRCNDSDIRTLTFDMGVDYENIPGASKADKIRELLAFVERTQRTAELIATLSDLRPDLASELRAIQ